MRKDIVVKWTIVGAKEETIKSIPDQFNLCEESRKAFLEGREVDASGLNDLGEHVFCRIRMTTYNQERDIEQRQSIQSTLGGKRNSKASPNQ